jgi:hypothetical protein
MKKSIRMRCEYYTSSIQGRIIEIKSTQRSTIAVRVTKEDKWYYLGTEVKYDIPIEVGDSLVKKSNDYNLFIIKKGIIHNIRSDRNFEKWARYCNCR